MAPEREQRGLVLLCDAEGNIVQVMRDDFEMGDCVAPGRPLTLAVDRRSFAKALSFMAELRSRGRAFDWEMNVPIANQPATLHFAGALANDHLLILAAESGNDMLHLCNDIMDTHSERVPGLHTAIQTCVGMARARTAPDTSLYDEITRLNNELMNLRRDLEKRVLECTVELRASETRFRTLFEQIDVGIALVSLDGTLVESNPALQEMLGHSADELRGRLFTELIQHPEQDPTVSDAHQEWPAGKQERYRTEQRYMRTTGQPGWVNWTASLVRNENGQPTFVIYMVEDITEQKQTQAALWQAERLTIAGKLAASLAHEINNPLQSVIGFLGLAEEALADGGDVGRYVQIARQELHRVARVVGRLRNLHRPSRMEERRPTDVKAVLEEVMSLSHKRCADHGVECVWDIDPTLAPLSLVPDRIQQVFLNLVLNAIDAMPEGGNLQVTTSRTNEPSGVSIAFADNGVGITPEVLPHIFDPFYSTKPDGLGLGLFISQEIIQQHGGHINVQSRVGEGTTFTIWLPA
jgi:PAS domain S-box-containing protein